MNDYFSEVSRFWRYNPLRLILTTFFLFLTVVFEPLAISFMLALLSIILDIRNSSDGMISEMVLSLQSSFSTIELLVLFCIVFVAKFIFLQTAFWYASRSVAGYAHHLRTSYFCRVLSSSYQSIVGANEAKMMSIVGVDSLQAGNSITAALRCFVDSVSLAVYVVILMIIDWRAFLVSTFVVSMMFVLTKFIARTTVKAAASSLEKAHGISKLMKNVLRGFRSIKVYSLGPVTALSLKKLSSSLFVPHAYSVAVGQYLRNANEVVQILGLVAVLVTYWIVFGYDGVEILGALALFQRVGASTAQLSGDLNKFQSLVPYLRNFKDAEELKPENFEENTVHEVLQPVEFRSLTLKSVGFIHESGRGLERCSLSISEGYACLIRGASGSGKSTLIDCILGLLDYQKGSIYIDDQRVSPSDLRLNRRNMALVDQFPYFGGGHIFKMLLEESLEKRSVFINCLEFFGLENLVERIRRNGLETLDRADDTFSGGERQRVAIALAVALATDRKLIIFDEPTAALDSVNSALFRQLVMELKRNKIVLIVSHDQEMVECVDQIIDLGICNGASR